MSFEGRSRIVRRQIVYSYMTRRARYTLDLRIPEKNTSNCETFQLEKMDSLIRLEHQRLKAQPMTNDTRNLRSTATTMLSNRASPEPHAKKASVQKTLPSPDTDNNSKPPLPDPLANQGHCSNGIKPASIHLTAKKLIPPPILLREPTGESEAYRDTNLEDLANMLEETLDEAPKESGSQERKEAVAARSAKSSQKPISLAGLTGGRRRNEEVESSSEEED